MENMKEAMRKLSIVSGSGKKTEDHLISSEEAKTFRESISNIISARETKKLNCEEQKLSDEIDSKFKTQKNGKLSVIWERIQIFYSQQANFHLKELEEYVRKEVFNNNPDRSKEENEGIVKKSS